MHSGFVALRNECGMNLHRKVAAVALSDDARANIARIQQIWSECHRRYGGPFLFGAFGAADAMYAPVVHRFRTYAIEVDAGCAALFRRDDGAAGVPAMDPRGAGRDAASSSASRRCEYAGLQLPIDKDGSSVRRQIAVTGPN